MSLIDLIYPRNCLGCGESGGYLCHKCRDRLRIVVSICPYCLKKAIDGTTHTKCQRKYGLSGLICFWQYRSVLRKVLLALKYKFAFEILNELIEIVTIHLKKQIVYLPKNTILVPIPLHKRRENWRGYNQVEKIGANLAKVMNWQYAPNLLVRKVATVSQTTLKKVDRRQNVKNVFALNPYTIQLSAYTIVLFDDVWTTGSTIKEAASVFKRKGIKEVWGLTLAR